LDRAEQLRRWLVATLASDDFSIAPASDDASFRRYFRIRRGAAQASLVAMDAPPDKENCAPFVHVAHLFAAAGVHVPTIHAQDLEQGFLLLSDLGDTTYLDALDEHNAGRLYEDALAALLRIQRASRPGSLPDYDRELLEKELRLFPDWYIARQLQRELDTTQLRTLEKTFSTILDNNLGQARVFVHRDYHSRNLMVCEPCPGILDFQPRFCATPTSLGTRNASSIGRSATGRGPGPGGCRSPVISRISIGISSGWEPSGSSRCWGSSRAFRFGTARTVI